LGAISTVNPTLGVALPVVKQVVDVGSSCKDNGILSSECGHSTTSTIMKTGLAVAAWTGAAALAGSVGAPVVLAGVATGIVYTTGSKIIDGLSGMLWGVK